MPTLRLSADWLVPGDAPPVAHGAVLIGEDGRIAAVGPGDRVPSPAGVPRLAFQGGALLPGLVNAHTHLELTGFEQLAEESEFPRWIRRIVELKAARTPDQFLAAARSGLSACWAAGVTTVADTGDSGAVPQAMAEAGASGIAYLEVFGPHPAEAAARFEEFQARLEGLRRLAGGRLRFGVSPHAPYSVSAPLARLVADYAAREALPLAAHIAESEAEERLLRDGSGGFAEAWRARGIPLPGGPGASPVDWLRQAGALGPRTLCIHAVRVSPADLELLRSSDSAVAHCPRSNRRHAGREAPLAAMLGASIRTGVGTDSAASVAPPDLLAEARAARSAAGLDAARTFALITSDAARALGLEAEIGSLSPGKWGDVAVMGLPPGVDGPRLMDILLARSAADLVATYLAGRPVWRAPSSRPVAGPVSREGATWG